MTDLLTLVKGLKDYITHLTKSIEEERQAHYAIRKIHLQDPEMDIKRQALRSRRAYLSGKVQGLYGILGELEYILTRAENQEEKEED